MTSHIHYILTIRLLFSRSLWMTALQWRVSDQEEIELMPTDVICSLHFTENDYEYSDILQRKLMSADNYRAPKLKKSAVPHMKLTKRGPKCKVSVSTTTVLTVRRDSGDAATATTAAVVVSHEALSALQQPSSTAAATASSTVSTEQESSQCLPLLPTPGLSADVNVMNITSTSSATLDVTVETGFDPNEHTYVLSASTLQECSEDKYEEEEKCDVEFE